MKKLAKFLAISNEEKLNLKSFSNAKKYRSEGLWILSQRALSAPTATSNLDKECNSENSMLGITFLTMLWLDNMVLHCKICLEL